MIERLMLITLFSAYCSINVQAQQPGSENNNIDPLISFETYCQTNICRKNYRLKLRIEDGVIDELLEYYWAPVQGEQLSLLAGEKLFIEVFLKDGNIISFRQVPKIISPETTLMFDFSQSEKDYSMTLSVKNPFSRSLKFHIDMLDFTGEPHQTSSCPIIAGGSGFETWPHPIPELILSNLHLQRDDESRSCSY